MHGACHSPLLLMHMARPYGGLPHHKAAQGGGKDATVWAGHVHDQGAAEELLRIVCSMQTRLFAHMYDNVQQLGG